jgi:putative endonuclease
MAAAPVRKRGQVPSRRRRPVAAPEQAAADWFVYLLTCGDGTFYTGVARDVAARLEQHRSGRGARYTRGRGPLALVHVEPAGSRGDAQRREAAIRRLRRAGKEALARAEAALPPARRPAAD